MKKRLILIVDHPQRELKSKLFLLYELLEDKYEIFIVSFNQLYSIPFKILKNSIIIFNYIRKNIFHNIIFSKYIMNCKVIVYDTEGVSGNNGYGVIDVAKQRKIIFNFIDQYWTFGQDIHDKLSKLTNNSVPVGYAKFDKNFLNFYKKKINLAQSKDKYILVSTNFSLLNPKYNSKHKELKNFKEKNKKLRNNQIANLYFLMDKFIFTLSKIFKKFNNEKFLLRVHPFENIDFWKSKFKKFDNVIIRTDGDMFDDLIYAKLLLHKDCMSAVEAKFLGINSISLKWTCDNNHNFLPAIYSSIIANNYKDLEFKINQILNNRMKTTPISNNLLNLYLPKREKTNVRNKVIFLIENIQNKNPKTTFFALIYSFKFILSCTYRIFFKSQINKDLNIKSLRKSLTELELSLEIFKINKNFYQLHKENHKKI